MPARHQSPLAGAFNFRDLGGLPLKDGRRTRRGVLFRSDTLQALTAEDVALLRDELGLRVVIDLRLAQEVTEEGRGPLADVRELHYVNAPLQMASIEGIAPEQVMNHLYGRCLASDSLVAAVARIAEQAGAPTVFHCAAGKDRTGIVAAMVLDIVGATREAIIEDYLATAPNMPSMVERFMSWPRYREHLSAMPREVYAVEVAPLQYLLDSVKAEFGSAEQWAIERGIPSRLLERLRAALVSR